MANETLSVPYVNSSEEVENLFQELKNSKFPSITSSEYLDYVTRVIYFFDHADEMKISPENNRDLASEPEHKKLITVPTDVNNYTDFQKGDFIPVCRVKKRNGCKAYENDVLISIDTKKGVVWARISTQKLVYGKDRNKIVDSQCFCVSNYCIPNLSELVRGKNADIIHNKKGSIKTLGLDYTSDYEKYKLEIAKGVLQVSRMDIDVVHQNEFDSINGYNLRQKKLLKEYFTNKADPPHFHFIYKDYVLYYREHDGSAMAINSDNLTKYLIDLSFVNISDNDDLLEYSFGMPFVDIKKRKVNLSGMNLKSLLSGIVENYNSLSANEQKLFVQKMMQDMELKVRNIDKMKNKNEYNKFLNNMSKIVGIVTGSEQPTEYDNFNALDVLLFETNAITIFYNLSQNNKNLKAEIEKSGNNFYDTIEHCLSTSLYKKNYNDYNNFNDKQWN